MVCDTLENPEQDVEDHTAHLLRSFQHKHGTIQGYAIPIDTIAETYLGLHLECLDLNDYFGVPNDEVFGCLDMATNTIIINRFLWPEENGGHVGKFNFSVAHEVAHHERHREAIMAINDLPDLWTRQPINHLCYRADATTKPIEREADHFAAAMLMPRAAVLRGWAEFMGSYKPMSLPQFVQQAGRFKPQTIKTKSLNALVEIILKPMAASFGVSAPALRIRLLYLGLLTSGEQTELS